MHGDFQLPKGATWAKHFDNWKYGMGIIINGKRQWTKETKVKGFSALTVLPWISTILGSLIESRYGVFQQLSLHSNDTETKAL